jgi:hypothetical protein
MPDHIVILANSRKLSGRCVAGKNSDGTWIRLTKQNGAPIPVTEARNYHMLNFFDVDGLVNRPSQEYNYHTENSTYTRTFQSRNYDNVTLESLLDYPDDIFGIGRRVDEDTAQELDSSLLFVEVEDLCISKENGGSYKDKLRGSFTYNGIFYSNIAVTDSVFEYNFSARRCPYQENYPIAYITISLGELFQGYAYKLLSGIYIPR